MKFTGLAIVFTLFIAVACSKTDLPLGAPLTNDMELVSVETPHVIEANTPKACPEDMIEVEGDFCTTVEQPCLQKGKTVNGASVCLQFGPSGCTGAVVHKHYCIDTYEYPNKKGQKPESWMSWHSVKSKCEAQSKRLCTDDEWTFACEGPEMHPYPYGDGYHRDHVSCNTENKLGKDVRWKDTKSTRLLDALLVSSGSKEDCVSPFGVYDMVGNIDEEVLNPSCKPFCSGLKGGHVYGVRNMCRPTTEAHNEGFAWYESGGRCCSDTE